MRNTSIEAWESIRQTQIEEYSTKITHPVILKYVNESVMKESAPHRLEGSKEPSPVSSQYCIHLNFRVPLIVVLLVFELTVNLCNFIYFYQNLNLFQNKELTETHTGKSCQGIRSKVQVVWRQVPLSLHAAIRWAFPGKVTADGLQSPFMFLG